jgi:hypothetical protein
MLETIRNRDRTLTSRKKNTRDRNRAVPGSSAIYRAVPGTSYNRRFAIDHVGALGVVSVCVMRTNFARVGGSTMTMCDGVPLP